jgi:hypothetical protein
VHPSKTLTGERGASPRSKMKRSRRRMKRKKRIAHVKMRRMMKESWRWNWTMKQMPTWTW